MNQTEAPPSLAWELGAKLMPLNELNVETVLSRHEPGRPIYVLCQAGARASKAIEQFERAGCYDCVLVVKLSFLP